MNFSQQHSELVVQGWERILETKLEDSFAVLLDGMTLTLSDVVVVARHFRHAKVEESSMFKLEASLETLRSRIEEGEVIYGVNTGFGGTADVRSKKMQELQQVLIRELHYGILEPSSRDPRRAISANVLSDIAGSAMQIPKTWTRAAILIRINTLLKGCSAIRPVVVERMSDLLRFDIIPVVPLRGSISASGDLSPLSYLAGAIQGKPTIRIHAETGAMLFADDAFTRSHLSRVTLGAKEGLAIVNGTAVSAGAAALALHDANVLLVLAQVITAMSVECLLGSVESFEPFFSKVRPHPGQIEVAKNILAFLENSSLVEVNTGADSSLRQDRYSIRTAPQWIGPILEDILLSHTQITTECNSATDNPLITKNGRVMHGGNFQAMAVTSALEKIRQGNCAVGRMLFAQCTEMINPSTSRGLPPNLVSEDPSTSFNFKGTDINMAALQAELGFLSNPVNHVQSAEMGNQSLNSLALLSARYTHTSNEVLTQMSAAHLIAACQAVDLRAMNIAFFEAVRDEFHELIGKATGAVGAAENRLITEKAWKQLRLSFDTTTSLDTAERFPAIVRQLRTLLYDEPCIRTNMRQFDLIDEFSDSMTRLLQDTWCTNRDAYTVHGDATPLLGQGTRQMYDFVRNILRVPFLRSENIRTPVREGDVDHGIEAPTVGSYTTLVYEAIRDGSVIEALHAILQRVNG